MKAVLLILPMLSSCSATVLVSNSKNDFSSGYATLRTTRNTSPSGEKCLVGELSYYKLNSNSPANWILTDAPHYAAPGTYLVALQCQEDVSKSTGQCLRSVEIVSGGSELQVTIEASKTYEVFCVNDEAQIREVKPND